MKIMYCITRSNWGGAQAHVFELIKDQINRGNEVSLVIGEKGDLFNRVAELEQVQLIYFPYLQRSLNLRLDVQAIFKLHRLIKKISPDILHLHSSKAGAIGRLAARGLFCKVIFTVHGWAFTEGVSKARSFVYRDIEKILANYTDKIICVSQYDLNLAVKMKVVNLKKAIVILNGAEETSYVESNSSNNKMTLTMVARFDTQKNQELLIKSVESIKSNPFIIQFVGEGPTKKNCEQLVHQLDLSNNFKFLGFRKDVQKILDGSDAFILITNYEGLPISIIEALREGLPVIASDVGGINEMVREDYNGFLVNNGKGSIDINNAILTMIKDKEKRKYFGNNSRYIFEQKFTLKKELDAVNTVYKTI